MGIYSKPSSELVFDLINRDNPQLPVPLSSANCTLGTPVAVTPVAPDYRNTRISVIPKKGGPYLIAMDLTYRRLDARLLFTGSTSGVVQIKKYSPNTTYAVALLRDALNSMYDLRLDASDLAGGPWSIGQTTSPGFTATSLAWVGVVNVRWTQDKKPLSTQLADESPLGSLILPEGVVGGKTLGQFIIPSVDLSDFKADLETTTQALVVAAGGPIAAAINNINQRFDLGLTFDQHTVQGGLAGAKLYRYTLPVTAIPEAAPGFNRLVTIQADATSWFQGKMMLHYNV